MDPQSSPPAAWSRRPPEAGRLLVAAPALVEDTFYRTVIYLLEHDESGTLGMVLNRPSHTPVGQVLPAWHDYVSQPDFMFVGGPVQVDGALCLAELREPGSDTKPVVGDLGTVDLDGDPDDLARRSGRMRVFAGHSGWAPGQLESELAEGAWYVVPGSVEDVFTSEPATLWRRVLTRQPPPLNLVATFPPDVSLN